MYDMVWEVDGQQCSHGTYAHIYTDAVKPRAKALSAITLLQQQWPSHLVLRLV